MTTPTPLSPPMALALSASFGSVERWQEAFQALAQSRAEGELHLSFSPALGRLVHDATHPALPLLTLGLPAPSGFMAQIDWAAVYERYQHAVHATSEALAADASQIEGALVLDVRRDAMYAKADSILPGAAWQDPARVDDWVAELPRDRAVIVYCIYGHEVGRSTAMRLQAAGVQARYLDGGIEAWTLAGRPLQAKPD